MKSYRNASSDSLTSRSRSFEGAWKHSLIWLSIPIFACLLILSAGRTSKRSEWDTGDLDSVDKEMFRKALLTSSSSDAKSTSKIAFLFLIRRSIPLEPVWERFFKNHEEEYSIYIHASFPGLDCDSVLNSTIFKGRQIPSVPINWGGPNMVRAERRLLAAALADANNERFVLVSESCLPIRNFTHVYNYLFSTNSSFVSSNESPWRYKPSMSPLIKKNQFRKGSQWFALIRDHAMMVVNDTIYYNKFLSTKAEIPDESYIQTMLPILDPSRVITRGVEYVHWRYSSSQHPMVYGDKEISEEFIKGVQESRKPPVETVGFLEVSRPKPCTVNGSPKPCFLFARKFSPDAVSAFLRLTQVVGY